LELAIVLPILSMLIVGIIDWGFILFIDQQMIQAAREGVRIRAAEGENYDDSRAQQATEEYLAAVYPSLAGDFTVTASGNSGGKAWVQVVIPLADASLTSGLLVLPGGDLSIRIEMDYLGATP
jgi:Flp pilus assembly protein TadG